MAWVAVPVETVLTGSYVAIRNRSWLVKSVVRPSAGLIMLMGGPFGFQAIATGRWVYVWRGDDWRTYK